MPASKQRKKKGGSRKKRRATKTSSSPIVTQAEANVTVDLAEEARLLELARKEEKALSELRKQQDKRMKQYIRFVALGRGANSDHVRARRSSYHAAGDLNPKHRRASLEAAKTISKYPLAFTLLTPKDEHQITNLVVQVKDIFSMHDVEKLLLPFVANLDNNADLANASEHSAPKDSQSSKSNSSDSSTAVVMPHAPQIPETEDSSIHFSFFYSPAGSQVRRRLETGAEWRWALRDFHKRRNSTSIAKIEDFSRRILMDTTGKSDISSSRLLHGIHELWDFAKYTESHMYITSEEIDKLSQCLRQSRRLAARSAAAGALWTVANNTRLRSLVYENHDVLRTLADPSFLSSFNGFADSDRDSTRTHVHVLGLVATLMADGSLGADDILGVGGTALLGTYLKHSGTVVPQGSRLAARALYDSCLLSVKAQHRIGRTCNPSTAVVAAAEYAAREAALDPDNAAALVALGEFEKTLAPVNVVNIVVRALSHIKDRKTFQILLRTCVLFSHSPSNLLRESLALATTASGVSAVGVFLTIFRELRGSENTSSVKKQNENHKHGSTDEHQRFAGVSAEVKDDLILQVLSILWGVFESATRSEQVLRRGGGSLSRGALTGITDSATDICEEFISYTQSLAHRRNKINRQKPLTKQIAYCAISAVSSIIPLVLDESSESLLEGDMAMEKNDNANTSTVSIFYNLSSLFDEARSLPHEPLPERDSRSILEMSTRTNGKDWASVRQRTASAMALLASKSITLAEDLASAGFFSRLISQVEEEQEYEEKVRERKKLEVKDADLQTRVKEMRRAKLMKKIGGGELTFEMIDEPTACEWLLRAVAALTKATSSTALPATLIERCCKFIQDPMWLSLLRQKHEKEKRKADRERRFSTKKAPKKSNAKASSSGAYFPPTKNKMTIREKAEAEAKAKANAAERKRLEAMEGPADKIGNVSMNRIVATVREIGDGLESVLQMLWRLARHSKEHRMAMLLDNTLVNMLRDAAERASALGVQSIVESVLATLHMIIVDILEEEEASVPKGEYPPGITKIQSLPVEALNDWVDFLLGLCKDCCGVGERCFENVSKYLVQVNLTRKQRKQYDQTMKKAIRPQTGAALSTERPTFGGRTSHVFSRFGRPIVAAPKILEAPKVVAEADPRCNIWTLATSVLWMLSLSKSLGFRMIDAGLPKMLVRMTCERGERLTPLLRIRAAGAAQFMSMRAEYSFAFQQVTKPNVNRKNRKQNISTQSNLKTVTYPAPSGTTEIMSREAWEARNQQNILETRQSELRGISQSSGTTKAKDSGPFISKIQFPEILAVTLLHMKDYDMRCYGTTCIARQAVIHNARKKSILVLGGIDLLVSQLDEASNQSLFAEFATQAILNLSSYAPNQEYICVCCKGIALKRLLNMVRDPTKPASASYATAVLSNISKHPSNRTRLYKAELSTGATDTFGPAQKQPIDSRDVASYQGIGGRLLTFSELDDVEQSNAAIKPSESLDEACVKPNDSKAKRKIVRSRFDAWFADEVEKDMTEAQIESIRKLEGDVISAATSKRTHKAHRPRSPRLVSEHVRQLNLRATPVPHKMITNAAKRNLQKSLCQPLSTLWHGKEPVDGNQNHLTLPKRAISSVKQLAMTASVQAGHKITAPGLSDTTNDTFSDPKSTATGLVTTDKLSHTPAFDPTWMDPESRSVLRWAPLVHKIKRAPMKASDSITVDKIRSGRRADLYTTAPPDMTVYLEPRQSPRNQVKFKDGGIMLSKAGSARLAVWTHIEGSKASTGLFPEYPLPGGGKVFFYEHTGLHEAIFPPESPPLPPTDEEAFGAPIAPQKLGAPQPHWKKDPPILRSFPAPSAPPCPVKSVGLDSTPFETFEGVLGDAASTHKPSFFIAHRAHLHVAEKRLESDNVHGLRLEDSIFAPRPYESDSGSFWDDAWVEDAAFRVDWARAVRKQAYRNVITGSHGVGHCAFLCDDQVEVQDIADHRKWYQAEVRRIMRGPSLEIEYTDGSREYFVSLGRVRYPGGGKAGGFGGRCRRWRSPRTEVKTHLLKSDALPDIVGLNGAEIRRIRLQSGCKITVQKNGDNAYAFRSEGVPENLEVLERILSDIDHISLARSALAHNYATALRAFHLFCSSGSGNMFALTANEYNGFLVKCKIVGDSGPSKDGAGMSSRIDHSDRALEHSLRNVFKAVNFEEAALDEEQARLNEFNLDSAIMRFEWLELLTRVAMIKYGTEASGLDEAIEMLFHRNIEPYLGSMGHVDHDIFRDKILYQKPVDHVLSKYRRTLIDLFTGYAGKLQRGGATRKRALLLSQPEYLDMLRELHLITHMFSVVEAKFAFGASKMLVIDDVNQTNRSSMITFVEFLESIVRACHIMLIPTREEIREAGFDSYNKYHENLVKSGPDSNSLQLHRNASRLHAKTASKHFLHRRHADARPIQDRLEIFLELIKDRLPRKGSINARRRISKWYADKKFERSRNSAYDSLKYVNTTTLKTLHDSVQAPKLVWVRRLNSAPVPGVRSKEEHVVETEKRTDVELHLQRERSLNRQKTLEEKIMDDEIKKVENAGREE